VPTAGGSYFSMKRWHGAAKDLQNLQPIENKLWLFRLIKTQYSTVKIK